MKKQVMKPLAVALLGMGLIVSSQVFAADSVMPSKPERQSVETKGVQPQVEKASNSKAAAKRKEIAVEATAAISETQKALQALEDNNKDKALKALEAATGKLEVLLARDPKLALAPISVDVATFDLLADPGTVKRAVKKARELLADGRVQDARSLLANLASEMVFTTTSIPLATYPDAIKAITPLVDAGKIDAAKVALRAALNTLVVTDEIIPLPVLRAGYLLKKAEVLAENKERTDKENKLLATLLKDARTQIKLAEALGYGDKKAFKSMYQQIDKIEEKSAGGKGGSGWFDELEKQLSDLF